MSTVNSLHVWWNLDVTFTSRTYTFKLVAF